MTTTEAEMDTGDRKVWVVKKGIRYEGSSVIAVCDTLDKAMLKIEQGKQSEDYPGAKWNDCSSDGIIMWEDDDGLLFFTAAQWTVE